MSIILNFVFDVSGCVSISVFASLVSVHVAITSFAVGLKICALTVGIKKLKSIIKRKKNDNIVLLAKTKLNTNKILISQTLIDSYVNHDEFVSVNNLLREYNEIKHEIKNPINVVEYKIEIYFLICRKNTANKNFSLRRTKKIRLLLVSNGAVCRKRKWRFVKS